MAEIKGFFIDPEETPIGIRSRSNRAVKLERVFYQINDVAYLNTGIRLSDKGLVGIGDYDSLIGNRSTPMLGFIDEEVDMLLTRTRINMPIYTSRVFYIDTTIKYLESGIRPPVTVNGVMPWVEGNLTPRRYPLELSWRSPVRQKQE